MIEPNFRATANFIMGCKGMEEDSWREEIINILQEMYSFDKNRNKKKNNHGIKNMENNQNIINVTEKNSNPIGMHKLPSGKVMKVKE
jgi:hypothetical protein